MTVETSIRQYANAKKKFLLNNDIMKEEYKQRCIKNMENAIRLRERGLITVDECIKMIYDCCID